MTLDAKKFAENFTPDEAGAEIPKMQITVYVMAGGNLLGSFAAEQPADFYIDDRVGRRPYPKKVIYKTVQMLAELAIRAGLNPHSLSKDYAPVRAAWNG